MLMAPPPVLTDYRPGRWHAARSLLAHYARETAVALLPEPVLEARRARQRGPLFAKTGLCFIHVPRSAGTSIVDPLYGRFIGHFTVQHVLDGCAPGVVALPRFALVRNPWDRLVSAYEFARCGGNHAIPGCGVHTVRVAHARRYRERDCENFERFVQEYLVGSDPMRLDGIFRPQRYYICAADGSVPFDHLGHVERMDETAAWLEDALGRRLDLGHFNASPRHNAYRCYYSPKLTQLVGDFYADDVALLGYDF